MDIDIFVEQVEPGDSILLWSDGLSNMVTDQEIGAVVSQDWIAETAVNELVAMTKRRGAPDNVTAVLINVVRQAQGGVGRLLVTAGIMGALAILVTGLVLGVLTKDNQSGRSWGRGVLHRKSVGDGFYIPSLEGKNGHSCNRWKAAVVWAQRKEALADCKQVVGPLGVLVQQRLHQRSVEVRRPRACEPSRHTDAHIE